MSETAKHFEELNTIEVPYGQIKVLAKRFRTTSKTISMYLKGEFGEWSRARAKQMKVREYAIKTYRL